MSQFTFSLSSATPRAVATIKPKTSSELVKYKRNRESNREAVQRYRAKNKAEGVAQRPQLPSSPPRKRSRSGDTSAEQPPDVDTTSVEQPPDVNMLTALDDANLYRLEDDWEITSTSPPPFHDQVKSRQATPTPDLLPQQPEEEDLQGVSTPATSPPRSEVDIQARRTPTPPPPPPAPSPPTGVYTKRPRGTVKHEVLPDLGVAIDPRSPYAVWAAGEYLTRLPYIPDVKDPNVNALTFTAPHVEQLVKDTQDARGSPYIDYYTHTKGLSQVELGTKIKESLSKGRFAVLEGCPDVPDIELSLSSMFESLHLRPNRSFEAQDMLLREKAFKTPYVKVNLEGFIENMKDPNKIQAILDCPSGTGQHPVLVGHVDEGYVAVDGAMNYFRSVPVDMKSSRVWIITHHPLFHTFIHHDASGTGTWTMICSGFKFWVIAAPNGEEKCTSLEEFHRYNDRYVCQKKPSQDWAYPYASETERFCIFGKQGDIIFQPPNAWHEVFTPCTSVTIGGHLYTYDTLHFTDAARHFDIARPGTTNQHHSSSQLTISAMAIQILKLGHLSYHRKPLTSLCRMILMPHLYLSKKEPEERDLLNAIGAYINHKLTKRRIATVKATHFQSLPPIARRAIWIADFLVEHFSLDYANPDHLFSPIPWTDAGEELVLTDELITEMEIASDKGI